MASFVLQFSMCVSLYSRLESMLLHGVIECFGSPTLIHISGMFHMVGLPEFHLALTALNSYAFSMVQDVWTLS